MNDSVISATQVGETGTSNETNNETQIKKSSEGGVWPFLVLTVIIILVITAGLI